MNYHATTPFIDKTRKDLIRYINMKLAAMGQPIFKKDFVSENAKANEAEFLELAESLLNDYKEKLRLLSTNLNPVDNRIQKFINRYFQDIEFKKDLSLPYDTFVLDKPGIAREVSLPADKNEYFTRYHESYRIEQGILHNPLSDRRTTKDSFHIVKGGLPIPPDKKAVPKVVFANMLHEALNPPEEYMVLPFTASCDEQAKVFVSLMLKPTVSPSVNSLVKRKTMEIRFFAPGNFVSNLDFVESIFGNAGNPALAKNDIALYPEEWSGHTGCIILAPHLRRLRKKDLGLPHWEDASERIRRDELCWKSEDELYNNGEAFKITCRDESGVVVTLIADNYFGYSKKEVKTQLSYAANLLGNCEEEHAGGTIAFARKNMGKHFLALSLHNKFPDAYNFEEIKSIYRDFLDIDSEDNYATDRNFSQIIYVPENSVFDINKRQVEWEYNGSLKSIKLLKNHFYIIPCGFKIHLERHPLSADWNLISTQAEGSFMHKPCTVSGGGKSEISKSLLNAIIYGTLHIDKKDEDFKKVDEIINYDYSRRWRNSDSHASDSRSLLSPDRSLGSTIELLTSFHEYTDEYNSYLSSIPDHVKALVFLIKRISLTPGNENLNWKERFTIDKVNGRDGHILMFDNTRINISYLRVGFNENKSWEVFSMRPDFISAAKVQMEDDISVTITLPASHFPHLKHLTDKKSLKFVENCEYMYFQRPDEAVNRGYDIEAEADLAKFNNFTTNYRPLTPLDAQEIVDDAIEFDKFTDPIKNLIAKRAKDAKSSYFISPAHPRILPDGTESQNPRYLQTRPDFTNPLDSYLAQIGTRLATKTPPNEPVIFYVNDVLPARRNNPPDKTKGIKPLSVYAPIHYQELPELFMDFICSLTGKSPSTTGAGSEGALTKSPFNMLTATTDLNNALISYILSGHTPFTSAAGYVGHKNRFDHDISILIPELWCRLLPEEKIPTNLIKEGALEKIQDFEYNGETILASRLGYRINEVFAFKYLGRIFEEPLSVFTDEVLRPEKQSVENYVDGIKHICEAQTKVALQYFEDGSVDAAIPPLKALLHIMAHGNYEGKLITDPQIRNMFTYEYVINSDWYQKRLENKQHTDASLLKNSITYIKEFISNPINSPLVNELNLEDKLLYAQKQLKKVESQDYIEHLKGTIGRDFLYDRPCY